MGGKSKREWIYKYTWLIHFVLQCFWHNVVKQLYCNKKKHAQNPHPTPFTPSLHPWLKCTLSFTQEQGRGSGLRVNSVWRKKKQNLFFSFLPCLCQNGCLRISTRNHLTWSYDSTLAWTSWNLQVGWAHLISCLSSLAAENCTKYTWSCPSLQEGHILFLPTFHFEANHPSQE